LGLAVVHLVHASFVYNVQAVTKKRRLGSNYGCYR